MATPAVPAAFQGNSFGGEVSTGRWLLRSTTDVNMRLVACSGSLVGCPASRGRAGRTAAGGAVTGATSMASVASSCADEASTPVVPEQVSRGAGRRRLTASADFGCDGLFGVRRGTSSGRRGAAATAVRDTIGIVARWMRAARHQRAAWQRTRGSGLRQGAVRRRALPSSARR